MLTVMCPHDDSSHTHTSPPARGEGGLGPHSADRVLSHWRVQAQRSFWTISINEPSQIQPDYKTLLKTLFEWPSQSSGTVRSGMLSEDTFWDWEPLPSPWWVIISSGDILEWALVHSGQGIISSGYSWVREASPLNQYVHAVDHHLVWLYGNNIPNWYAETAVY